MTTIENDTQHDHLSPAEMARRCSVSVDTLRYYEREGLLTSIERTSGGQRRYGADDVAWVQILRCLRTTALPIREMKRFAELVRRGDEAIPERAELLRAHRRDVEAQIAALHEALETIDHKIAAYSAILENTPEVDHVPTTSPTLRGKGIRREVSDLTSTEEDDADR